jgi:hypothetical protein
MHRDLEVVAGRMRPDKPRHEGRNQERAPDKDRKILFRQKSAIHCSGPENYGWSNFCLFDKVSERLLSARRAGSARIKFSQFIKVAP